MAPATPYRPFPPFADWVSRPVDLGTWNDALRELEAWRSAASSVQEEDAARYVTRATAVDTSAIEGLYSVDRGFTMSVAAQDWAWEQDLEERGGNAREHFDAQLRAFDLVLEAATRSLPVTEALIRGLHEHVCAAQESYRVLTQLGWQDHELVLGRYKRFPNNPRRRDGWEHAYAPVAEVGPEMRRLVGELASGAFLEAPAPVQAAYAHYALVSIHPFADGNGRVARALASIYLVRTTSVPFLLYADLKGAYLDALETADRGSYHELTELVRERSTAAMNTMAARIRRALVRSAGEVREPGESEVDLDLFGGPRRLDRLAGRLLYEAGRELRIACRRLEPPLAVELEPLEKSWAPPAAYRSPEAPQVGLRSAQLPFVLRALVARDSKHPLPLRIEATPYGVHLDAGVDEVYPEASLSLRQNLGLWAETLAAALTVGALR